MTVSEQDQALHGTTAGGINRCVWCQADVRFRECHKYGVEEQLQHVPLPKMAVLVRQRCQEFDARELVRVQPLRVTGSPAPGQPFEQMHCRLDFIVTGQRRIAPALNRSVVNSGS